MKFFLILTTAISTTAALLLARKVAQLNTTVDECCTELTRMTLKNRSVVHTSRMDAMETLMVTQAQIELGRSIGLYLDPHMTRAEAANAIDDKRHWDN